ncbi:hypothetical protein [Mucilaginibacter sp. AK015]|uniref:hypothetical protein n=1 Tax=Mucilaginibacter sp. AK015 TaxID=2723072 RepID=UPI00161002BA|nr:hypothetical protein [Mucilaginibacter sp. AK015]MBB5394803.1 hypothetical protein [Mucilaginibacter sp. AK015]
MDKNELYKDWQEKIEQGNDLKLSAAAYPQLALEAPLSLLSAAEVTVRGPVLTQTGPDGILLKGGLAGGNLKVRSFQVWVDFEEMIFTSLRFEIDAINFDWLRQKGLPELPGELASLSNAGIEKVIVEYLSDEEEFRFHVIFADIEIDIFKDYHLHFRKPLLTAVISKGQCRSVSITVAADFLGRERDFRFSIPFTTGGNWEIELLDETDHDIKLADAVKQVEIHTGRQDLFLSIPDLVTDQLSNISITALRFSCSYTRSSALTFSVTLSSFRHVSLLPGITLAFPRLVLDAGYIGGEMKLSVAFKGVFAIRENIKLGLSAFLSTNPALPWNFHIDGMIDLENIKLLEELPFGIDLSGLNFPGDIAQVHSVTLRRFDVIANLAQKKISQIELDLSAECELQLIRGIWLANPRFNLSYLPGESTYDAMSGSFKGELLIGKTSFYGEVAKSGRDWTLTAGTGLTEPFLLRQFVAGLNEITHAELPVELIPDIKVGFTELEYQTGNGSLSFTSSLEVPLPLPFLTDQSLVLGSYIDVQLKRTGEQYDLSYNFSASLQVGLAVLAVAISKDEGARSYAGGWKAVEGEGTLSLAKIARAIGIELDLTSLPALLNPQFCEIAFSYTQADGTFALSAYTTNNTTYFFIARKTAGDKWHYVIGLDYDIASPAPTDDIGELSQAAKAAGLTQLHLLYAGTDLQDFSLPRVPDLTGKGSPLDGGKLLTVKKGLFIAAEANNIATPQIGKLRGNLKQFYVSVEKREQVVVLVKGHMDLMAGERSVNIDLQAGFASGAKDLSFSGKVVADIGLMPLLSAIFDEELALPEGVSWPDISEAGLAFSTAEGTVNMTITTVPARNRLAVDDLFSIGADRISLNLSKSSADLTITGGHLQLHLLDDLFPGGVGGALSLHIEKANNRFVFKPSGFEIVTPKIDYQECTETTQADGKTQPKTITRSLCAKLTPGEFSFKQEDKQWTIAAEAVLILQDLPDPVRRIFMEEKEQHWVSKPLLLAAGLKNGTLFFAATGTLLQLEIPDLMAEIGVTSVPAFGKSAIRLSGAEFYIGKDVALELEFGYALPMRLNEVLGMQQTKIFKTLASPPGEQFTRFRVSIGSAGISGQLIDSPFYTIEGITEQDNKVRIDLNRVFNDKDLGCISFIKPVIKLDVEKGTFQFKGGYEIDPENPVAIPLTLLRRLFEALKLNKVAQNLPKSIPVKTMKLEDTLTWLINMLDRCGITLPKALGDLLLSVQKIENSLPARFRGYLSLSVPRALEASVDITADGGIGFSLTTKDAPLQFLVPTPLAFVGLRLSHISLGTAMGGSLLKFECSAELDTFDYAELLLSTTLYQSEVVAAKLPPRDELQHTFAVNELLILIVYETGIPIPVPLFYENILFKFKGIEGLDIHTSISFPQPKVNVMKVLKIASDLKKLFSEGKDLDVTYPLSIQKDGGEPGFNLVFDAGPFYMRLPKYVARGEDEKGLLLGWTNNYRLLDLMNLAGILLNGINHLIKEKTPAYLVQALPLALRYNNITVFPLENLEASVAWLMATPKEVTRLYQDHQLPDAALEELVPLLSLLTFQPGAAPDSKAVTAPDNAVLFFMQGKLKVGSIAEARLSAALCWLPDGLASSMLIHVAAPNDILLLHLDGKQAITATNFQVSGNTYLKLFGFNIFQGTFIAAKGMLYLEASAFDTATSPIGFYGKIEGVFNNDVVKLNGIARFKFFAIHVDAQVNLDLNNSSDSSFSAAAMVSAGEVFSGTFLFRSLLTQNSSFDASVNFELKVLNIFGLVYEQHTHIDPLKLQLQGEIDFLFLGRKFLSAALLYQDDTLSIAADFTILDILRIKGAISIRDEYFQLGGELSFDLAGITTTGTIDVLSDKNNKKFELVINKLFGDENTLKFSLQSAADSVKFLSYSQKPISVFNGMLLISGVSDEQAGPVFAMGFDHIGMQYLMTEAKVNAFGLAQAAVTMQYANATGSFSAALRTSVHTGVFESDAVFNMIYNTNLFKLTGALNFGVDLGLAIKTVFYNFFHIDIAAPSFFVQFELSDFEFSVECTPSPVSPDLREIEKAIEAVDKRIAEINALSKTALEGLNHLFAESAQTVAEIDNMLNNELQTWQRSLLIKWKDKLPKNIADIQPFITNHNNHQQMIKDARLELSDASYKVRDFESNWASMLRWFDTLDSRAEYIGIDWSGNSKYIMMMDKDNTYDYMADVLQNIDYSEIDDIHENYYGKHCYKWIGNRQNSDQWIQIKKVDLDTRKEAGYQWRKGNFDSIVAKIDHYEAELVKFINLFNNAAIPIIKADLLQSHIDMKLINTYKKSDELAKHELPLTTLSTDAVNANNMIMRVVFRGKGCANIPGIGKISLGDVQVSWAGISDLGADSSLWQHLQRALNAYLSQQLMKILNEQYQSIWEIAACLKRMIAGGNAMQDSSDVDLASMIGGFALLPAEVSKNMKDTLDNPPPLSIK